MDWKNIPGYPGYQASIYGQIRKILPSGKIIMMHPYVKKNSNNKRYVVKMTVNGKSQQHTLIKLIALTFLGPAPEGMCPIHKNRMQSDNSIHNIMYIKRCDMGFKTGAASRRKPVAVIDQEGNITDVYPSAREAARHCYCSRQSITDRCNGKVKKPLGSIDFYWDDEECSQRWAIRRMELAYGSIYPTAPQMQDWED